MSRAKEEAGSMAVERFDEETTRATLAVACEAAGLDPAGAALLRLGENALYRLSTAPLMARVGRSTTSGAKDLQVSEWLQANRFPAVTAAKVKQRIVVHGMAVTFWDYIDSVPPPPSSGDLGATLRRLHGLPSPSFTLPTFAPMPKVEGRLTKLNGSLPPRDLRYLRDRMRELSESFAELECELSPGPIHGDAHRDNLLRDRRTGQVKLIDLEDFCVGPREWDLCVEAIGYVAFGWISSGDYERYVESCGFDALRWPGFKTFRAIRELNMTTWLAQRWGQSPDVDAEISMRIRDLRNDDAPRKWSPF